MNTSAMLGHTPNLNVHVRVRDLQQEVKGGRQPLTYARGRAPLRYRHSHMQYYLADHAARMVRAERALPSNQVVNASSPL